MMALAFTAGWLMVIGMLSVCKLLNDCAMPFDVGGVEPLATPLSEAVT